MSEEAEGHLVEAFAPLQNSIEIGETSKGMQLKSIKLYFGNDEGDWEKAVTKLFQIREAVLSRL